MSWFGKDCPGMKLIEGDFLDQQYDKLFKDGTVFFINNNLFRETNFFVRRDPEYPDGTKIVTSEPFSRVRHERAINERNFGSFHSKVTVEAPARLKGKSTWTNEFQLFCREVNRRKQKEVRKCYKNTQSKVL